jgi:hypothetical protein
LRLVDPSACWKASKMICCLSGEMPIPESDTREGDDLLRLVQLFMVLAPAAHRRRDGQRHLAVMREFKGV